jgi:uncharacterized protein (TIGR02145 family)
MCKVIGVGRTLLIAVASLAAVLAGCGDNGANSGGGGNTGIVSPNTVVRGTFTDNKNGQTYKTVKIGGQTWMGENMNIETADSWCYEDSAQYCAKYGRLYTWTAAKTACQSIGWKLPDTADWNKLATAAGGWEIAGSKLKSKNGWIENGGGTDDYGFLALSGGCRNYNGGFGNAGNDGFWWTATGHDSDRAHFRLMGYYNDFLADDYNGKSNGYSVRCVKE